MDNLLWKNTSTKRTAVHSAHNYVFKADPTASLKHPKPESFSAQTQCESKSERNIQNNFNGITSLFPAWPYNQTAGFFSTHAATWIMNKHQKDGNEKMHTSLLYKLQNNLHEIFP